MFETITIPKSGLFQVVTCTDFLIPNGLFHVAKHMPWNPLLLSISSKEHQVNYIHQSSTNIHIPSL